MFSYLITSLLYWFTAVTRAQVTAPPGFSVPNRAPPPGFSSHERLEQQTFDHISGWLCVCVFLFSLLYDYKF